MLDITKLHKLGFLLTEENKMYTLYTKASKNLVLKVKPYYKDPQDTYGQLTHEEFGVYSGIITIELLTIIMKLNNY